LSVGRQKAASEVPLISRHGKPKRNRAFTLGTLCLVILGVAGAFYWYQAAQSRDRRKDRGRRPAPASQ